MNQNTHLIKIIKLLVLKAFYTLTFSNDKSPPSMALNGYNATTIVVRGEGS